MPKSIEQPIYIQQLTKREAGSTSDEFSGKCPIWRCTHKLYYETKISI